MNEINIQFNKQSPQEIGSEIEIKAQSENLEKLFYKFIVGIDGTWKTIRDFSLEENALWIPQEEGKYIIMVQARKEKSTRSLDFVSRIDYLIGLSKEKLISAVNIDKVKYKVGEKINISVESSNNALLYRYWVKEKDKWELIKDYSSENTLVWSVKNSGSQEILVECKHCDSQNNFDDFQKVQYEASDIDGVDISDFRTLSSNLITGNELVFRVDALHEDLRSVLFKFVKIKANGDTECVQDYSTKKVVSFIEKIPGEYKLLCMAKDMYSQKEFDDRAIISYKVKPYKEIIIRSFTSNISSPQICFSNITFKAVATGGTDLVYRFIIDGSYGEDSGYIRSNEYVWKTKKSGEYKITLWVKDISYEGNYEVQETMKFNIDEMSVDPVNINEILLDRTGRIIKNQTINIKAIASGGIDLRYAFNVIKGGVKLESIEYGTCNWVNFTPETGGKFDIDVMVKDKYSVREYDCHSIIHIDVYNYIPSNIDHILMPVKEYYSIGDNISFEVITQNSINTLVKYVLFINGHKIEETKYITSKKYSFIPRYSGIYNVEIYAKNKESRSEFDSKKNVKINVCESLPVTNTKIKCDKEQMNLKEPITFIVDSQGGKEVLYEFYIMEYSDWKLVQNYSRKNFYTFMPFINGIYKVLVLCKSSYKKCSY
ncbi:MAG: triple tyrosine motif-containing protein [Bacillota bacterium]|nr:triple tyrosine motif-containing protein [Bacillota bacterium]